MSLYDSKKLPPFIYSKTSDRSTIEHDPLVLSLIKSRLLLNVEFPKFAQIIVKLSKEVESFAELSRNLVPKKNLAQESGTTIDKFLLSQQIRVLPTKLRFPIFSLLYRQKLKQPDIQRNIERANVYIKRMIRLRSTEIVKLRDTFEKKTKTSLDVLDSVIFYFCKHCKTVIAVDHFHSGTCSCGNAITLGRSEAVPIFRFNDNTIKFIENGIWLEHGIDYLLQKKNFKTECGISILGRSGVRHEVDNFAEREKEGLRIFGECKSGLINDTDVFVFHGKLIDLGGYKGCMFTVTEEKRIPESTIKLARAKDVKIITSVLNKSEKLIIQSIDEITK